MAGFELRRAFAVAALVLAGCLHPSLVDCPNDLECPGGDVCDLVHDGCVAPAQLTACATLAPGADCTAGAVTGGCFDGVCLPRGCGNGIVEPGEACDDGNQISGDGCSDDCLSTEVCGNGVVDQIKGEQCDDGNLMSRDGCDSRCLIEQAAWSVVPIAPITVTRELTAYDRARARLVSPASGGTWEFDGTLWTLVDSALDGSGAYYDPVLAHVVAVGHTPGDGAATFAQLFAWDGAQWTQLTDDTATVGPGKFKTVLGAAYDVANARPIVIVEAGSQPQPQTQTWTVTAGSGAGLEWSLVNATLPPIASGTTIAVAYDQVLAEVVVVTPTSEYDLASTAWTTRNVPPTTGASLTATPGEVVLVDNAASGKTYTRAGDAAWVAAPDATACADSAGSASDRALYVDATGTVTLFATDDSNQCTLGAAWSSARLRLPFDPTGVVADPPNHRFVVLHDQVAGGSGTTETWTFAGGAWTAGASGPSGRVDELTAYDLGIASAIVYGGHGNDNSVLGDAWAFGSGHWRQLASVTPALDSAGSGSAASAILVYDPAHERTLLADGAVQTELANADVTAWQPDDGSLALANVVTQPAPLASAILTQLAWDPRQTTYLAGFATQTAGFELYEQAGSDWLDLPIAAHGDFKLITDDRTGGIDLVATLNGTVWELRAGMWLASDPLPYNLPLSMHVAYDPADGTLAALGAGDVGYVLMIRTRTSPTPLESCNIGDDLDGDGLFGCRDPDCFWACGVCPPLTTCAPT